VFIACDAYFAFYALIALNVALRVLRSAGNRPYCKRDRWSVISNKISGSTTMYSRTDRDDLLKDNSLLTRFKKYMSLSLINEVTDATQCSQRRQTSPPVSPPWRTRPNNVVGRATGAATWRTRRNIRVVSDSAHSLLAYISYTHKPVLAGNDTVPISMWRGRVMRSTECPVPNEMWHLRSVGQ